MHNADFLGIYVLRDRQSIDDMPSHNSSGMWQAWLSPGGGILVRALDQEYQPLGDTYPMSRESFFSMLLPLAPRAGAGPEAPTEAAASPDLPDLLDMWYTQAAAPRKEADATERPAAPDARNEKEAARLAVSVRETLERMRGEFAALMSRMNEQADPDLDRAMEDMLSEAILPSDEQKFMFTDFGRALRRKGRYKLSLAAHLRALACAPDDEHVLFNVARSQYEAGQSAEAEASLEKAVRAAPDFREAAHFLQFLRGASKKG